MGFVSGQGWMLGLICGKNFMEAALDNISQQRMKLMQGMLCQLDRRFGTNITSMNTSQGGVANNKGCSSQSVIADAILEGGSASTESKDRNNAAGLKIQDNMLEMMQKQFETKLKYIMQQIESVQKIIDENIKLSKFDVKV